MKKEVWSGKIDAGVCEYINMLHYDKEGLKVLNSHIARAGGYDEETFRKYVERYQAACRRYYIAFNELCGAAVPKEYRDGARYQAVLQFDTGILSVCEVE